MVAQNPPYGVVRRRIAVGTLLAGAGAAALAGLQAPAASATGVTFTLAGGSLSISQPSSTATLTGAALGPTGTTMSGALGATTVTDNRGSTAGWTSTIATTAFSDGGTGSLAASTAKAYVPSAITTTGTVTASAGLYVLAGTGLTLSTSAQSFVTGTLALGVNSATFTPYLAVTVPATATTGTYTGTVTQTVS